MADGNSDAKSLGLRCQKKLLSKMTSKKIAKTFIDDTSGRLLDNLHRCAKEYHEKKVAEKALKNLIKIVIKIGILYRNDQFNHDELQLAENFKQKFHTVGMTIVSFYEVDFTFDKVFLVQSLQECHAMLKRLVQRHLTEKSLSRIDHFFGIYSDPGFVDALFKSDGKYHDVLGKIVSDLNKLLEDGVL